MIPRTLSASSVQVAEGCLARFAAENINYAGRTSNDPALLGSTCHSALEDFVRIAFMERSKPDDLELLLRLYTMYFVANFGSTEHVMYQEGVEMLTGWHERTVPTLEGRTILSVEKKLTFPLRTSIGDIPFTYIMDRLDQISENEYEIIDYKSIRWGFNPGDLEKKIQARIYALALSIQLKAMGIDNRNVKTWVTFDLLRHSAVGRVFTHAENLRTYKYLQEVAERIISTPEENAPRTLNPECHYCTIKASCPQLISNIAAGGSFGMTPAEMIDRRSELEYASKAIKAAIEEIDGQVLTQAREEDVTEYTSEKNRMSIKISSRRTVDADMVERVVGTDVFQMYGGKSITMGNFDKMQKDPAIQTDQKRQLKSLVQMKTGEPSVKVEARGFVDDND